MTVRWTVRATEPTAVFFPQRKYKTVGSSYNFNQPFHFPLKRLFVYAILILKAGAMNGNFK